MQRNSRNREAIKNKLIDTCFAPANRTQYKQSRVESLNYDSKLKNEQPNKFQNSSPYFANFQRISSQKQITTTKELHANMNTLRQSDRRSPIDSFEKKNYSNDSRITFTPVKISYLISNNTSNNLFLNSKQKSNLVNYIPPNQETLPNRYKQLINHHPQAKPKIQIMNIIERSSKVEKQKQQKNMKEENNLNPCVIKHPQGKPINKDQTPLNSSKSINNKISMKQINMSRDHEYLNSKPLYREMSTALTITSSKFSSKYDKQKWYKSK